MLLLQTVINIAFSLAERDFLHAHKNKRFFVKKNNNRDIIQITMKTRYRMDVDELKKNGTRPRKWDKCKVGELISITQITHSWRIKDSVKCEVTVRILS